MFKTSLLTIIAAVVSIGSASNSQAAPAADGNSFKVSTAGLDLQTVSGGQMMFARIQAAAKHYCQAAPLIADLAASRAWNDCVNANISRAVLQINAPSVSVAYSRPVDQILASNGSGR